MSKVLDQMADMAFESWQDARRIEDREHHRVSELEAELIEVKADRDSFWDSYVDAREQLEEARAEIVRLSQELQTRAIIQADIEQGGF